MRRILPLTLAFVTVTSGCTNEVPKPAEKAVKSDTTMPDGPMGVAVRRGRSLALDTRDSLPHNVGAALRCTSCHLEGGTRANAMSWVGVYSRFPQYRARGGRVILIQDRINDCFERSLNGKALDPVGADMRDIVAYMAFLSRGIAAGDSVRGQGLPKLVVHEPDTASGSAIFAATCARCHGLGGEGGGVVPPVWGPRSFTIGAGMARLRTAASFIRNNMPLDAPGTLTDQQAYNVAGYIGSRTRPDFAGKENDWPKGDPPPDVAYATVAAKRISRRDSAR